MYVPQDLHVLATALFERLRRTAYGAAKGRAPNKDCLLDAVPVQVFARGREVLRHQFGHSANATQFLAVRLAARREVEWGARDVRQLGLRRSAQKQRRELWSQRCLHGFVSC